MLEANNNLIRDLPINITSCTALSCISFDNNKFKEIPEILTQLKNLRKISFKGFFLSTYCYNVTISFTIRHYREKKPKLITFPKNIFLCLNVKVFRVLKQISLF